MSSAAAKFMNTAQVEIPIAGDFVRNFRDKKNIQDKVEYLMRSGRNGIGALTAAQMINAMPAAIASGSLGTLFSSTTLGSLVSAAPAFAAAHPVLLAGGGLALGTGYLVKKRLDFTRTHTRGEAIKADAMNIARIGLAPLGLGILGGSLAIRGATAIGESLLMPGGGADKALDSVISMEGGMKNDKDIFGFLSSTLEKAEKAVNWFNPANMFAPPSAVKKQADTGKPDDKKK